LHPLDNPAWQALNSADSRFNLGDTVAGYFPAEVAPFAALPDWNEDMQLYFHKKVPVDRSWFVVRKEPVSLSELWDLRFTLTLYQMVCRNFQPVPTKKVDLRPLDTTDVPEMLALTALTKPGPFTERTIELGNYHGVFVDDKLVSMAGERLHLDDYTEISAVCTYPEHTGKGYAALLMSLIAEKIIASGKMPFLHVKADNERAIKMYERLGFVHRADMYFGIFKRREGDSASV
jgi:predicted GNAT family acetyltransferase